MNITSKLKTESARDYAFRSIKDNIISVALEPGSIVSESEIAQELGVSRTPVREALIELSKVNFVEILPQRGSMISKIDYKIIEESRFFRLVLERAIAEEACDHATKEDILGLENNIRLQKIYIEQNDPDMMMKLDNDFHRLLYKAAKKEFIHKIIKDTTVHFDRVRRLSYNEINMDTIIVDHTRIIDAIKDRDKVLVNQRVTEHLTRYKVDEELIRKKYGHYLVD